MNTYWTEAAWLYLIYIYIYIYFNLKRKSLKYDHQAFEERVFPEALLHCSSHDLHKPPKHLTSFEERLFVHLSIIIGLHCIICFDHLGLNDIILLRHIIGDIE